MNGHTIINPIPHGLFSNLIHMAGGCHNPLQGYFDDKFRIYFFIESLWPSGYSVGLEIDWFFGPGFESGRIPAFFHELTYSF